MEQWNIIDSNIFSMFHPPEQFNGFPGTGTATTPVTIPAELALIAKEDRHY